MNNTEVYEKVTASLLKLIDSGELLPWQKPWKGQSEWARSMSSGKTYNGINRWLLTLTAQENNWSPWFGTYRQIEALGGQVRKGEKSSVAILWKPVNGKDKATGETKKWLMLRTFNVFSASQADGLADKFYAKPADADFETDADAESVFADYTTGANITVRFGGNEAFYSPGLDAIQLPHFASFDSAEHFYGTAFHEAAHSTGHRDRLARPGVTDPVQFGSHGYSREELVAELGSSLVLGILGLDKPNVVENQAAYLAHWKQGLAEDPQAFVWAAGRAEKAANLILGVEVATEAPAPTELVAA